MEVRAGKVTGEKKCRIVRGMGIEIVLGDKRVPNGLAVSPPQRKFYGAKS